MRCQNFFKLIKSTMINIFFYRGRSSAHTAYKICKSSDYNYQYKSNKYYFPYHVQNLIVKSSFTCPFLKYTNPIQNKSTVTVTCGCAFICAHAAFMPSLLGMSSKISMVFSCIFGSAH